MLLPPADWYRVPILMRLTRSTAHGFCQSALVSSCYCDCRSCYCRWFTTSDAGWYIDRGMELASGEGYHDGPWPTAYWPIGYPLFLAATFFLFGHDVIIAQFVTLPCLAGCSF